MKNVWLLLLAGFIFCRSNTNSVSSVEQKEDLLKLVQTIPLPQIEGRIDHLDIDIKGQRLFIAALGNNSVEVIDLKAGNIAQSIKGLHEPQGVLYIPETDRLYIANGQNGECIVYEATSLKPIQSIPFQDDADNMRYDGKAKQLFVGFGEGALGVIDVTTNKRVGEVKLAGHPESFQLEKGKNKIYVNIPNAKQVAVIDRAKQIVVAQWSIKEANANFPMAFDETNARLFIGCRNPAKLIVIDTSNGKEVTNLNIVKDVDDIFYDSERKRIYLSGGEGFIAVLGQSDANNYKLIGQTVTAEGARTSLFVPELNQLYLAVPHRGSQKAEIRVYAL